MKPFSEGRGFCERLVDSDRHSDLRRGGDFLLAGRETGNGNHICRVQPSQYRLNS